MRTPRPAFLLLLITACGGCTAAPAGPTKPATGAESGAAAPEPSVAPRPFTAEQIRTAMPAGTEIRYRLEQEGKPAVILHSKVTAADTASMTMVSRVLAEDGSVIAEEPAHTTSWDDLLKHANFPADRTRRARGTVEVPAGKFETLDYVVTETVNGATTISTFRFAPSLPGPPVSLVIEKDGTVIQRLTLLSRQ